MKYTLKNRPKKWTQWTGENRDTPNEVSLPQNVEDWLSGFEAELREIKRILHKEEKQLGKNVHFFQILQIKEILGE